MSWGPPDDGVGINTLQSTVAATYLDVLMAGLSGVDCVLSGGVATGNSNMTYTVTASGVLSNQILKATAQWTATIGTAHATLPRTDLIVVDSSGAGQVRAGTAAAIPLPPARTANDVVLYAVYVPATATVLTSTAGGNLSPLRVPRSGPIVIAKTLTAVTWNTTTAAKPYFDVVIPNGLMLGQGRALRLRAGGTYLSNSGTPTFTLDVVYDVSAFTDASAATTADTDRGAWALDLQIADASGGMVVSGYVNFQTPGAKAVPTTGVGDLGVATHINAPIRGLGSASGGNCNLTLNWTMSVSNVNVEMTMDYATLELL